MNLLQHLGPFAMLPDVCQMWTPPQGLQCPPRTAPVPLYLSLEVPWYQSHAHKGWIPPHTAHQSVSLPPDYSSNCWKETPVEKSGHTPAQSLVMRTTGQSVSLVTQRLIKISTRKPDCSMINASHSPFLPHLLPRMVFATLAPIVQLMLCGWRQKQECTEPDGSRGMQGLSCLWNADDDGQCNQQSVYLPAYGSPGHNTLSLFQCSGTFTCCCKRIWSKNLQIILPWKHLSISGRQKRTPPHGDVPTVRTTARNCPTPPFCEYFSSQSWGCTTS